jgi:twitching motility protein PilT
MTLDELLAHVREREASDLHLIAGQPPVFRVHGHLERRDGDPPLNGADIDALLAPHLNDRNRHTLDEERRDADITLRNGDRRFRLHVYRDRGGLGAAVRIIPNRVPTLAELGLGAENGSILPKLTQLTRGLIVVTGPVGSGKTTTCAAMLEEINRTRAERIITLEDPVEYEFEGRQSLISQRSVGEDISDHPAGLRAALYMDPDVILVDRLRDLETTLLSITLAETGHLVFATLNVPTVTEAVQRIIESFPKERQASIAELLSRNLQAVVAQMLVPRAGGTGRVALNEVLVCSPQAREIIAAGGAHLRLAIEAGRGVGMQTFDDALAAAHKKGDISYQTAYSRLVDKGRIPAPAADVAAG